MCSCGYCTMTESEGMGRSFEIDHYIPVTMDASLVNEYSNLVYSCDSCNTFKLDLCPPSQAREDGHRYFRPDWDAFDQHFGVSVRDNGDVYLDGISEVGKWTIEHLELNRPTMRRLRKIRSELSECRQFVVHGVLALRKFHIDQLDRGIRGKADSSIRYCIALVEKCEEEIDKILMAYAISPLDVDDDEARARRLQRNASLKKIMPLYEGDWRGRHKSKKTTQP